MTVEFTEILKFLAFAAVWVFPVLLVIAILGAGRSEMKRREEDLGPNVIPFPRHGKE